MSDVPGSGVADAPRVLLPQGSALFASRAARFEVLSRDSALGGFLSLMGRIAQAQAVVFDARPAIAPTTPVLERSRHYGMPPLASATATPDAGWRADLSDLLVQLDSAEGPAQAVAAVRGLGAQGLDDLASRLLAGKATDAEAALVPFVGAALQVHFSRVAAGIEPGDVAHCDVAGICPVCGMRPVASVVRIGAEISGLRYLACSLCQTQWHMPRIRCTSCDSDRGIQYFGLEPESDAKGNAAWRAEACDECHSYLKIFYQDKDPGADAAADDLASLSLDLLLADQGFARSGPNLLFHPGTG